MTYVALKSLSSPLVENCLEPSLKRAAKTTSGVENLSILINDHVRLKKISHLVAEQLPLAKNFSQGPKIIEQQLSTNLQLKKELFNLLNPLHSTMHQAIKEIWDGFFEGRTTEKIEKK
jgi:hypothetical protein